MNFYEAKLSYQVKKQELSAPKKQLWVSETEEDMDDKIKKMFASLNRGLGLRFALKEALTAYVWDGNPGLLHLILALDMSRASLAEAKDALCASLEEHYDIADLVWSDVKEISSKEFVQLGEKGDDNEYIRRFFSDANALHLNYRENRSYTFKEELCEETELSYEDACKQAKEIMGSESLLEELARIYSDENEKAYYGNPVQYKISASGWESATEIIKLIHSALHANKRLLGHRISYLRQIKRDCYDETDVENLYDVSAGNVVVVEMSGDNRPQGHYANPYQDVVEFFGRVMEKFEKNTLCFFVEITNQIGFAKEMISCAGEVVDLVEITEGQGDRETAIAYLGRHAKESGYTVSREELEEIVGTNSTYSVEEINDIYDKWFRDGLKVRIYKAYQNRTVTEVKVVEKKSDPYAELQKMVGLSEIKTVVDEIIDAAKVNKLRGKMGLAAQKPSMHMIFTGNPGSAKTTVARLIAQILAKEKILDNGKFVECGRADLVGKYVGWTAKLVRAKFREAKGGVLFIDEAYSLVDGSNSFGDEAINTIVQEMENNRDQVVVVFAGYPDKMKTFLDKNEGLRSRINFHLNFPDYNAEEMVEILKLMATKQGFSIDEEICNKCHDIFLGACQMEEFGNGRFARNLLEQATMAQAKRILSENRGKRITKRAICTLKVADFEGNASHIAKEKKRVVGF